MKIIFKTQPEVFKNVNFMKDKERLLKFSRLQETKVNDNQVQQRILDADTHWKSNYFIGHY